MTTFCQTGGPDSIPGHYNDAALLRDQDFDIARSTLHQIADIFFRYEAHERFSVSLLHRHYTIPSDFVMVHEYIDERDICIAEPFGIRDLCPRIYSLNPQGQFIPFEYEITSPGAISAENAFLDELGAFILRNCLEKQIGLSIVASTGGFWTEWLLPGIAGTVATRSAEELRDHNDNITEWGFCKENGYTVVKALKICKLTDAGVHVPVPGT